MWSLYGILHTNSLKRLSIPNSLSNAGLGSSTCFLEIYIALHGVNYGTPPSSRKRRTTASGVDLFSIASSPLLWKSSPPPPPPTISINIDPIDDPLQQ